MTSKTSDFARYDRATDIRAPLISRKDTIIIAMLVNIALLVVLFATASRRHESDELTLKTNTLSSDIIHSAPSVAVQANIPRDEIDEVLAKLNQKSVPKQAVQHKAPTSQNAPEYYIVKSGDSPWKIARKFHIDFEDLLRLNGLDEEKAKNLKIGQKLRIR